MAVTRFRLNLPNILIELTGERDFVEELYRQVSRDLLPLYESQPPKPLPSAPELPAKAAHKADVSKAPHKRFTWIYACTDLFHKVYVVENPTIDRSIIGRWIDARNIRRLYLNREDEKLIDSLAGSNKTLWAEFTEAGREFLRKSGNEEFSLD